MADRALTEAERLRLHRCLLVHAPAAYRDDVEALFAEYLALRAMAGAAKQVDDAGQRVQETLSDNFSPQQHNAACEYEALCRVKLGAALAAVAEWFDTNTAAHTGMSPGGAIRKALEESPYGS